MGNIQSFEDFECWKVCTDLRRYISNIAKKFPIEEKYALTSQMLRASGSITNNIAEGYGRFHFKENTQFCGQSRGSLYELKDHLIIALDEKYISKEDYGVVMEKFLKCITLING